MPSPTTPTPGTSAGTGSTTAARRRLLITGLALVVAFAVFGWLISLNVSHPFVQGMDDAWRRLVGAAPGAENILPSVFFQDLGQVLGAAIFVLIIPGLLFIARRWRTALFVLASMVGTTVVAQIAKNLVNRPRPFADPGEGLYGPLFQVDHGSFPSGHAVTMGFIIVATAALVPAARRWIWWVAGILLGAGMVWQRTFINAHWLSDTLAGLAAGIGVTLILWWAFHPLLGKDRGRPLRRFPSSRTTTHSTPITTEPTSTEQGAS